jgi:hypothetical protein
MDSVKSTLLWKRSTAPSMQDFQFDILLAAAQHNWSTFESFERSLEKVIASDPNSILAYGSEFKPPEILAPLLASHPLWPHFKRIKLAEVMVSHMVAGFASTTNYREAGWLKVSPKLRSSSF